MYKFIAGILEFVHLFCFFYWKGVNKSRDICEQTEGYSEQIEGYSEQIEGYSEKIEGYHWTNWVRDTSEQIEWYWWINDRDQWTNRGIPVKKKLRC